MAQYQQRFGDCEIRIDLQAEHGSHAARLFLVTPEGLSPLLDERAQPVVVSAMTAALVYLAAVRYLTERFGTSDITADAKSPFLLGPTRQRLFPVPALCGAYSRSH